MDKPERSAVQTRNQIKYIEKLLNKVPSAAERPEEIVAPCEDETVIKDPINFGSTKMPKKETNLQRRRRLIKARNIRLKKLENETPEERQERLKKKRENARKCREKRELLKQKEQCDTHFELQPNCMPQDNGLLKVRSVTIHKEMNIFSDQICEQTKMPLTIPSSSNTADLQTDTVIKQENDLDHTIYEEIVDIKTEITTDDGVTPENTDNPFENVQLHVKQEHISLSLEKESTGSDTEDSQPIMDEFNDQKIEMEHYATVAKSEIDCDGSEVKEEAVMRDESLVTHDYPNFDDVGSMDSNEAAALTHVEACLQEEINIKSEDDGHDMNNTLEQKENSSRPTRKRKRKTSYITRQKQLRAAQKRYNKAHPEVARRAQKRYAERHPEVHRRAAKRYKEKHPEVHRRAAKRYREKNREALKRKAAERNAKKKLDVNKMDSRSYAKKILSYTGENENSTLEQKENSSRTTRKRKRKTTFSTRQKQLRAARKRYHKAQPEVARKVRKRYAERHPEVYRRAAKRYREKNRDALKRKAAERYAKKKLDVNMMTARTYAKKILSYTGENENSTLEQKENSSRTTRRKKRKTSYSTRQKQLRAARKRYHKAHPEVARRAQKRYAERHPEVHRRAAKHYREKNREALKRKAAERNAKKKLDVNKMASRSYAKKILSYTGKNENNTLEQKENPSLTTRKGGRKPKKRRGRPKTSDKSRKEQQREARERYKKAHPEAVKNAQKRYAENNREAHRNAVKRYAENNPEVNRRAVKRYAEKHPEVKRSAVKRYAEKNPEVNRRAVKRYREKKREEKRKAEERYAEQNPEEKEEYGKVNIKEERDLTVTETHLISNKLINTTSTITHPHDGLIESNTTKTLVMEILPMTRANMNFSKLGNPEEILPTTYNNGEDYMDYQESFQLNSITGNILSLEQEAYGLLKTKRKKKDLGDALLTCPKCPKTYRQKTCLKRHLTIHDSIEKREQGFQKSIVTKKENRKKRLKSELESEVVKKEDKKDIKKEGYECTCGQVFQRRSRMETCLRSHNLFSDTDTYPCVSCSKQFKDKEELALHRKRLHRKRFPCKFCPTDYHTRKELFKHLQVHQKVQLMEYKVISEVVKGKQKLKCFMCSKSYMELSDLKCHVMDDHKEPYSCPRCKRTFSKIIDFGNHTKTFHPEVEGQSVLDVLEAFSKLVKAWKCEECGLQFHEADKLAMHQIEKHSPDVKAETQFQCTDCRRVFISQKGLTSHRRIHHSTETVEESETIETGVMCLECRKICKDMNALLSHMRLHSPDRKYPCKFCDFRFATPEKRKAHAEIHTGDMKYVCFICEYQCSSENRLKQHKLSPKHINMKEFLLTGKPLVEEASSSKETLKKKEVVKEKKKRDKSKSVSESECSEVACDICGDKFPSESEMQDHKQTHPFIEFPNEDTPSRIFFK